MEYYAIVRVKTKEILGVAACANKTPDSDVCKYKLCDNVGDVPFITTNRAALVDVVENNMSDGSHERPFNPFQNEELAVVDVELQVTMQMVVA